MFLFLKFFVRQFDILYRSQTETNMQLKQSQTRLENWQSFIYSTELKYIEKITGTEPQPYRIVMICFS